VPNALAAWRQSAEIVACALEVKRRYGKGFAAQFAEILRLRAPPSRLGAGDYYDYRLFDDACLDFESKRRFVGWRGEPALDVANEPAWHALCDDKLAFHTAMTGAGIPVPALLAIWHPGGKRQPGVPAFETAAGLAAHLRNGIDYPFFGKPVHAGFGNGAALALEYARERDSIVLDGVGPVAVGAFVGGLSAHRADGYLFQKPVKPHPELAEACAQRLTTVRAMVLADADGPHLYRAIWKIPRAASIVDNFRKGTTGTMLGHVDVESGEVLRVTRGYGLALESVRDHPDTGLALAGRRLPDWEAFRRITLAAARALPGLRFQHWDIALAADGPVALEINLFAGGGTETSQIVAGVGLLEPRLIALCEAARRRDLDPQTRDEPVT